YPKQPLLRALRDCPDLAEDFLERLVKKSQSLKARLELRSIRSARNRVLHYLLVEAQPGATTLNFDRPLKDVAGDLGLTPEVLYRTLARLEREGMITRSNQQITLHPAA
ncbi:MAG TPA: helix-turn-helix domain-containing protein, partial [Candidatus Caenarcaniphilales bacterium]